VLGTLIANSLQGLFFAFCLLNRFMSAQVIVNQSAEPCDHGWIHHDRATTIDVGAPRFPEPNVRRIVSLDLAVVSADQCFEQGKELLRSERYQEAADQFNAAIQLQWTFTSAHIELGNAYSALGYFERALNAYQNALEADASSILAHYNIGVTFADAGDKDQAREWLLRTVKVDSSYRPAYIQLARLSQRDHVAIALLLRAGRVVPKVAAPFIEAGNIYYQNTEYARAMRCYQRALRVDPWNAQAFFRLGLAHYRNGRLVEAGFALANAVNRDPGFETAAVLLKGIERRLSRKPAPANIPVQSQLW